MVINYLGVRATKVLHQKGRYTWISNGIYRQADRPVMRNNRRILRLRLVPLWSILIPISCDVTTSGILLCVINCYVNNSHTNSSQVHSVHGYWIEKCHIAWPCGINFAGMNMPSIAGQKISFITSYDMKTSSIAGQKISYITNYDGSEIKWWNLDFIHYLWYEIYYCYVYKYIKYGRLGIILKIIKIWNVRISEAITVCFSLVAGFLYILIFIWLVILRIKLSENKHFGGNHFFCG